MNLELLLIFCFRCPLFFNSQLKLLNLLLLLIFKFKGLSSSIFFIFGYLSNCFVLLPSLLCSHPPLLLGKFIFPEISIKNLNFSIGSPPLPMADFVSAILFLSIGGLPTFLVDSIPAVRTIESLSYFFLRLTGKGSLPLWFIGDDQRLKVKLVQISSSTVFVMGKTKH